MKTVVISDIHLGIDDRIAENVKNRTLLISFLENLRKEIKPDEVVINGDFLDQWFLPASYKHVTDSAEFYRQVAKNNSEVIDAFKELMSDGIKLVYVPGNHDMTLTNEVLDEIVPGIKQVRDVRGLGKYYTGERNEVVIEHCHRYESFCAPDMISNKEFVKYGEPILPCGYFYALIGVESIVEGSFNNVDDKNIVIAPEVPKPEDTDPDKLAAYAYYLTWKSVVEKTFPVKKQFDEKFIKVSVDGFQGEFSLSDVVPSVTEDGVSARLYSHMQRNWDEIQKRNKVPAHIDILEQLKRLTDQSLRADYAKRQYFDIDESVDVVVFGHTHVPFYREYTEEYDRKKIYVNEGTWIDNNMDDPENTATFAEIESSDEDTKVKLLKCIPDENGKLDKIIKASNKYIEA